MNESTENMEEDAVHFLSSWSERARGDRSGDDTMDGYDMNGVDGPLDPNMDGHDIDGSSMDNLDKSSSRKQRKSTPRKIPRRASSGRKRHAGDKVGEEDQEEDEEGEDEMEEEEMGRSDNFPSLHFQALTDEASAAAAAAYGGKQPVGENHIMTEEGEEGMNHLKRSRRERTQHYAAMQNGDFVAGLSDSEKEEGEHEMVDDDSEWLPGDPSQKNGKGAKLDSLIAEKFKNS